MLNVNQQLMDDLGANVTPAIYYMNKDNMLQQVVGLPDKEKLHIMMGEKSNSIPQWRTAESTAGATVDDKIY